MDPAIFPRVELPPGTRIERLDAINHPPHYQAANGMEAIDVIESFGLNFNLGNAIKYLLRAGKKGDTSTDLAKASWYIAREIQAQERAK